MPVDEKLLETLKKKSPGKGGRGCFQCKLILEDLKKNGKLTGYPFDFNGAPVFPKEGKLAHLRVEGLSRYAKELT